VFERVTVARSGGDGPFRFLRSRPGHCGRLRPGDPCPLRVPPPPGASPTIGMHYVSAPFRSDHRPSRAGDGRGFPRT